MKHLKYVKDGNLTKVFYTNGHYMGDIFAKEDGFYDWWPEKSNGGYIPAWILRELADTLDELNKDWQEEIEANLA